MGLNLLGNPQPTRWHRWRQVFWVDHAGDERQGWELVGRVGDRLLSAVCYLYPNMDAAQADSERGGSGFLVAAEYAGHEGSQMGHIYAVTARHILMDPDTKALWPNPVVAFKTSAGTQRIETASADWEPHADGDDIAAASLPAFEGTVGTFLIGALVTPEVVKEWDIGLGDDVFYLGRFQPPRGQSVPTVRYGHISHMPMRVWHDDFGRQVDSFLIETRSRGGFSGSAVTLRLPWGRVPRDQWAWTDDITPSTPATIGTSSLIAGAFIDRWILGLNWGHTTERQTARLTSGFAVDLQVDVNEGIMCVAPSWRILDILNGPRFTGQRQHDEHLHRDAQKRGRRTVPDRLAPEPDPSLTKEDFMAALGKIKKEPKNASGSDDIG